MSITNKIDFSREDSRISLRPSQNYFDLSTHLISKIFERIFLLDGVNILLADNYLFEIGVAKFHFGDSQEKVMQCFSYAMSLKSHILIDRCLKHPLLNKKSAFACILNNSLNTQIIESCIQGNSNFSVSAQNNFLLISAMEKKKSLLVSVILNHKKFDHTLDQDGLLITAVREENVDVISWFFNNTDFDPSQDNDKLFINAAETGNVEMVGIFLELGGKRINPANQNNLAICKAAAQNYPEVVKMLLKIKEVNPSDRENFAIRTSAARGYVDVVKELLKHSKVDASAINDHAFYFAVKNKHAAVAMALLKIPTINPSARNNAPIIFAIKFKLEEIFTPLLNHENFDPSINTEEMLTVAKQHECDCVIKKLQQT